MAAICVPEIGVSEGSLTAAWFDSAEHAALLCDGALVIVAANRTACNLLRVSAGDILHRNLNRLLGASVGAAGGASIMPPPARLPWRCEVQAKDDRRLFDLSGVPLRDPASGVEGWALLLGPARQSTAAVPDFVGRSAAIQELLRLVARLAASRARSFLLVGESGTGKELIARRLHGLSPRAGAPLVPINCAALPEELLESELFGYEKGAFTGARETKEGLLSAADHGTVLLDEICELPLALQAKLLRVLEDHTFRRVGGVRDLFVDIRIVAATNADLEKAIAEGRFRSDLYYRLNGVQIRIPPLRERIEDLGDLTAFFIDHFNRVHQRDIRGVHPITKILFEKHSWPGNVRELRNVIERAVLVETSSLISPSSLDLRNGAGRGCRSAAASGKAGPRFCLHSGERDLIGAALAEAGGNQSRAAALLGVGRFGLRYKMKKLGMLRPS
jgi:two-component system response regulator AtoC